LSKPPRLHEQALPTLAALSRFWQFNRKKLVTELQGHIDEAQQQLDILFSSQQQLITQCTEQSDEIRALHSRNCALSEYLQLETAKLASTNKALELEKSNLSAATLAQVRSSAYAKDLEDRLTKTMARVANLETHLTAHKQQLVDKEQTIAELERFLEDQRNQLESKEHDLKLREKLTEQLNVSHQQLEGRHADISKQHLSLTEKFSLVRDVLALQPPANEALTQFAELVNKDYMEFAGHESSLANEAQAVLEMQAILAEMQLLNNFPSIAGKTILSIAGGFSSGKSAFVNSFISHPRVQLPVGINPVTVVPSYVVCSEETKIKGYSYGGGSIDLDESLYKSMCHEYVQAFGFDLRRILPFISVKVPMRQHLFDNLCIIDTPGYNPGASGGAAAADRGTASSLVNQASALVWVIGLDPAGTIDQSDIEFIESTRFRGESLYIVLNKADVKSEDDILQIMEQVADDLSFAGIEYAGICAHSSTRQGVYPFKGRKFEEFLCAINRKVDVVGKVTRRLDDVFDAYKQAIAVDIEQLKSRKKQFDAFKLYALEVGGTALFHRIDQAVPINEQSCDLSGLEKLADECEQLRRKLKQSCEKSLAHLK